MPKDSRLLVQKGESRVFVFFKDRCGEEKMERESLCIAKGILITGVERMEYGIGEPPARASFFSLFGDSLHLCQYGRRTGYKRADFHSAFYGKGSVCSAMHTRKRTANGSGSHPELGRFGRRNTRDFRAEEGNCRK